MDLQSSKVSDGDKLALCKRYFFLGFAMLPFLWVVNAVWFFREAFVRKPEFEEQKSLKRLVSASAALSAAFIVGLIAWIAVFVTHRAEWGAVGDKLSFNIPTGSP